MTNLKHYRRVKGLSQTDLTVLAFIPQSHISAIENGHRGVGFHRARRICDALGVEDIREVFPELKKVS